jgi:phage terminase small subunit
MDVEARSSLPKSAKEPGLTPKQERFVQEYLVDLNATQAAIRAGYSKRTADKQGYQLLVNPRVQAAIALAQADVAKRLGLDAEWVLKRLRAISDRCAQAEPVLDREGNETGEYRFDSAGANRATELIGKHLGMFTEKHELTGKDSGPILLQGRLSGMTEEQLKALLGEEKGGVGDERPDA